MLKFCPECGSKFLGGKFCSSCGTDISKYGEGASASENLKANSTLDDALGNLLDFASEKQAEDDKIQAQKFYEEGIALEDSQQDDKAHEAFEKAAKKGHAGAQHKVALWHLRNIETSIGFMRFMQGDNAKIDYSGFDFSEPLKWLREAIKQNHAGAQTTLGYCYSNGYGVPQNYMEAIKWWQKAAEQNSAAAISNLGWAYKNGDGVFQDYSKALEYYKKAADFGNANAMYNIGDCYEKGLGVEENLDEARKWYNLAAQQGFDLAQKAIERLDRQFFISNGVCSCYYGQSKKVKIPDGVTSIDDRAFYNHSEIETVSIPKSVIRIGKSAFLKCTSLREIILPDNLERIEESAFSCCNNLKIIRFNNRLRYIGDNAFSGCISLETINLPNCIESLGKAAFSDCNSLRELRFSSGLKNIPAYVLSGCVSIEYIDVPNSVRTIEFSAFKKCNSLKCLTIPFVGDGSSYSGNDFFAYIFGGDREWKSDAYTYVPKSLKTVIITGGDKIADEAFASCNSIESVSLPVGLSTIGYRAFYACGSLVSIDIPMSVINIGAYAFGKTSLSSVIIPRGAVVEKSLGEETAFPQYCQIIRK